MARLLSTLIAVQIGASVLSFCQIQIADAFVVSTKSTTTRRSQRVFQQQQQQQRRILSRLAVQVNDYHDDMYSNDDYNDYNDYGNHDDNYNHMASSSSTSSFDLEGTRHRLESLVSSSPGGSTTSGGGTAGMPGSGMNYGSGNPSSTAHRHNHHQTSPIMKLLSETSDPKEFDEYKLLVPPAPPITSSVREWKLAEIELLRQLKDDDDSPIRGLWDLWYNERGPEAARKLRYADELMERGDPNDIDRSEQILFDLIKEHGVHWAEPLNRLGTLYYVKGNLRASEAVNMVVLAVKPWHFGALSGLTTIYNKLGDADRAQLWGDRRLPTRVPGANARSMWIDGAIDEAKNRLEDAEYALQELFGEHDVHAPSESPSSSSSSYSTDEYTSSSSSTSWIAQEYEQAAAVHEEFNFEYSGLYDRGSSTGSSRTSSSSNSERDVSASTEWLERDFQISSHMNADAILSLNFDDESQSWQ